MTKKEFALSQIAPYYKDRSLCGYEGSKCRYKTFEGKMCVFGERTMVFKR